MNLGIIWRHSLAAITGALFLFSITDSQGSACATDSGEYRLTTNQPVGEYVRTQLDGMQFAATAQLYLTDAGEEMVKGLSSVSQENAVTATVESRQWRLTVRTADGKTGVLTLPRPRTMTAFAVDIHDEEEGKSPRLYKEWRFEGVPTGDGIFQAGFTAPARYTLVFQGRGNRCDNGEDFTHWRLEISGKKASYAFFGGLVTDAANP
jgi:hypothetical protein